MKNVRKNISAMALLALAMSALMPQKAQAQDRIPFLAEGKTWTVFNYDARYEGALVVKDSARYSVLGDTIVGGRTCKLVETEIGTVPAYQEGRNIYFYYPTTQNRESCMSLTAKSATSSMSILKGRLVPK